MTLPRAKSAIFLGSKSFGLAILKALITAEPSIKWTIIHPDDRSDPRSKYSAYESFAQQSEIELKLVKDRGEADAALFQISYDIAFVCGWHWLLGDHIVGGDAPPVDGGIPPTRNARSRGSTEAQQRRWNALGRDPGGG